MNNNINTFRSDMYKVEDVHNLSVKSNQQISEKLTQNVEIIKMETSSLKDTILEELGEENRSMKEAII